MKCAAPFWGSVQRKHTRTQCFSLSPPPIPYPPGLQLVSRLQTSDFRPDRETGVCRKPKTERRGCGDKMALGDKHARVELEDLVLLFYLSGPSSYVLPSKNSSPVSLIAFLQTVQHTRAYWRCRCLIRICN